MQLFMMRPYYVRMNPKFNDWSLQEGYLLRDTEMEKANWRQAETGVMQPQAKEH